MVAKPVTLWTHIKKYLVITFALTLYTLGWTIFLIPNGIVGGGATGIGTLVYLLTGFPVSYTYLLFNVVAIAIAMKVVGANFGVKTIFGVLMVSVLLRVEEAVIPFLFPTPLMADDRLLAALIGSLMSGVGIGISFSQGGSSGGTDIIAMIINKYRNITPGRAILMMDVVIIGGTLFIPGNDFPTRLETLMYGYIAMVVTAYAIDAYLSGMKQSMQLMIFSKHYVEIADRITQEMGRGATVIDGIGWYSKENVKIVMAMIRKNEMHDFYRIVKEEDKDAFISVANVMGVYGKGFDTIRK